MLRFSFCCLRPQMRTSFHHQPEAQHPNFPLSVSWQADYPIFWGDAEVNCRSGAIEIALDDPKPTLAGSKSRSARSEAQFLRGGPWGGSWMRNLKRRSFITLLGGPKWERSRQADDRTSAKGGKPMLKSVAMSSLAIALGVAAWLLPMRGEQATAQSGPLHILVVEYDIVPAEIDKYLTAIKELGAAAVKEPGCRQ